MDCSAFYKTILVHVNGWDYDFLHSIGQDFSEKFQSQAGK
jgi:hypothetical protein